MNSNYEWQKFAANNRVDGYRRQADAHRQAKRNEAGGKENNSVINKVGFAFAIGIGLLVMSFMLSGCQIAEVPKAEAKSVGIAETSMVERIRFHDQLWADKEARSEESVTSKPETVMSMADRIRFHDQLWANSASQPSTSKPKIMTMADRIRFHDQLQC